MIDDLLMLTCGWVGGVVTALLIRHEIDGRQPLDPALLPTPAIPIPTARGPNAPASGAPQRSPYAPITPRPEHRAVGKARTMPVAAKLDRPGVLRTHEQHKLANRKKSVPNPLVQHAKYIIRDFRDCVG